MLLQLLCRTAMFILNHRSLMANSLTAGLPNNRSLPLKLLMVRLPLHLMAFPIPNHAEAMA